MQHLAGDEDGEPQRRHHDDAHHRRPGVQVRGDQPDQSDPDEPGTDGEQQATQREPTSGAVAAEDGRGLLGGEQPLRPPLRQLAGEPVQPAGRGGVRRRARRRGRTRGGGHVLIVARSRRRRMSTTTHPHGTGVTRADRLDRRLGAPLASPHALRPARDVLPVPRRRALRTPAARGVRGPGRGRPVGLLGRPGGRLGGGRPGRGALHVGLRPPAPEFLAWAPSHGGRPCSTVPTCSPGTPTSPTSSSSGGASVLSDRVDETWWPARGRPRVVRRRRGQAAVGAGGRGVVVDATNGGPAARRGPAGPWVVQPLVESVRTEGETRSSCSAAGRLPGDKVPAGTRSACTSSTAAAHGPARPRRGGGRPGPPRSTRSPGARRAARLRPGRPDAAGDGTSR